VKLLLPAALVALAAALPTASPAAEGDLEKLQGTWKTMVGPNQDIPMILRIQGNQATATVTTAQGQSFTLKGEWKVDEKAQPKAIDWVNVKGGDGQDLPGSRAIYKLDGDTLTVCTGPPDGDRPTEFKVGEGRFPNLRVYSRQKDEPKPADADAAKKGDLGKVQGRWKAMAGPEKNIPVLVDVKGQAVDVIFTSPEGQDFTLKGEVRLNDSASPKTLDWVKFVLPNGEDAPDNLGIYRLDGDEWTICSGGPGNERPAEFKAGEGRGASLLTLKREKSEK
jgi:uncharacterized protein (TIGR03067 family)